MNNCPLTVRPGQILGHRTDGRPIFAIAGGSEPTGDPAPTPQPDPAPAPTPTPPAPTPDPAPAPTPAGDAREVKDLPEWAQKVIADARKEAGDARVQAKNATDELTKNIGKALGLIKDDEKPDPAKLTEQLTATQAQARIANVQLAVFQGASKHQADPSALLDSNSFMTTVKDLDPTAADFADKVDAAIKAAVEKNSKLKAGRAPGMSSVDGSGGPGERRSTEPKSLVEAVAGHYGT